MGSAASKFPYFVYCDNQMCMLRKNEWYASFPDLTYTYRISMKNKYPPLAFYEVRMYEEGEDFYKTMFD